MPFSSSDTQRLIKPEVNKPVQQPNAETIKGQKWQNMTLGQYVALRNGVPLGDSKSIRNMLERSLGAGTPAGFWQYWNPLWGYGLGKYVYTPLRKFGPAPVALVLTFVVSGALHDLAATLVTRATTFLLTPWFFIMGLGVVLGHVTRLDYSSRPWLVRATINLTYILGSLALTLLLKAMI